ncbi:Nn.00g029290.m01.CDS01 [Neocucurbitaria sp. VM-36]
MLVAGQQTHFIFSQAAVQALLKLRSTSRETFERNIMGRVFDFGPQDANIFFTRTKEPLLKLTHQFLLRHESANELVNTFLQFLPEGLNTTLPSSEATEKDRKISLCEWMREALFNTSTKAIFGQDLAKLYPGYYHDYYTFDTQFQKFFFGVPRFMNREAFDARTRALEGLEKWGVATRAESKRRSTDSEANPWDPVLGSRLVRARMASFDQMGHNTKAVASLDLGLTSALVSNAVPATTWMLLHVLNPNADPSILQKVLVTVANAEWPDGSLNIAALVEDALLTAIWVEVLRLYTDVLLSRDLGEDLLLPLDIQGLRKVSLRKGDNIIAPSWLAHRDATSWPSQGAPLDVFSPERHLSRDVVDGSVKSVLRENDGKFFPFGGGKTHCPGRIFAKMEAIGAFALILSRYDIKAQGFIDTIGHHTSAFPRIRNALPGSMLLVPEGDLQVIVRPKRLLFSVAV